MELENHSKPFHSIHTLLHGTWSESNHAIWCSSWFTLSGGLLRSGSWRGTSGLARSSRRSLRACPFLVSCLPAKPASPSRQVPGHAFSIGDLVLQLDPDTKDKHKLACPWEGPFIISHVLNNGAYRLYDIKNDEETKRTWNINLLRPFYTWVYFLFTLVMFSEHSVFKFQVRLHEIKFISSLVVLLHFRLIYLWVL